MESMSREMLLQRLDIAARLIGQAEATTGRYNQLMGQVRSKKEYVEIDKRLTTKGMDFLSQAAFVALAVVFGLVILLILLVAGLSGNLSGTFFFKTVLFVAIVVCITHFIRKRLKDDKVKARAYRDRRGREQAARQNQEIDMQNTAVRTQARDVEREIAQIREQAGQYLANWYPPDYCYSDAVNYFIHAVKNFQANDMGQAVRLYEEERRHREHMAQLSQLNRTTQMILFTNIQMMDAIYENTDAVNRNTDAINNYNDNYNNPYIRR